MGYRNLQKSQQYVIFFFVVVIYKYLQIIISSFSIGSIYIIRPRRLSSRGSGFLLTKNRADQPHLSNVVQLSGGLPRVENGNKY